MASKKIESPSYPGALENSFLRSAYVVMDLTHNQMFFAQAVYTSDSNFVEILAEGIAPINT